MDMLNSIIIEGTVKIISFDHFINGKHKCRFSIMTNHFQPEEESTPNEIIIPVECMGNVAQMCMRYFKAGTQVRIVGNLAKDNENHIIVFAQHIELKFENKEQIEA
jgi:hypothetical protein